MERVFVFCDEFGTSTLKQNDVKNITKFVYCSVVIKESNLKVAYKVRDEISNSYLFGQPIKSSSKRLQDDSVRLSCVKHLISNLPFSVHFLIVDKEKIEQDSGGLRFKEVFYKYFQKLFVSDITRTYTDFLIYMDKIINESYGVEMKKYLSEKIHDNLFEKYQFSDDKDEVLIQLSDLLAGSVGKIFNVSFRTDTIEEIFKILIPKIAAIKFFPEEQINDYEPTPSDNDINTEISEIVRRDAEKLFNESQDEVNKIILDRLLFYQKFLPLIYLQTYELTSFIKLSINRDISIEQLRLSIRDLRFKGIVIVSANNKSGYKLAVNKNDIYQYFNHYSKYILPMLKKIQIVNDIFLQKTVGDFSPLSQFEELIRLVEAIKFKR